MSRFATIDTTTGEIIDPRVIRLQRRERKIVGHHGFHRRRQQTTALTPLNQLLIGLGATVIAAVIIRYLLIPT